MKTRTLKTVKNKEPSLLRQLVSIYFEQSKRRKALRLLQRQEWSFDFLSLLLVKAGKSLGDGIQLVIENKHGQKMSITYSQAKQSTAEENLDSDILNNLDNITAVNDFIKRHGRT